MWLKRQESWLISYLPGTCCSVTPCHFARETLQSLRSYGFLGHIHFHRSGCLVIVVYIILSNSDRV